MLPSVIALAVVLVLTGIAALGLVVKPSEPSSRLDPELYAGLIVMASVFAALSVCATLAWAGSQPPPFSRASVAVGAAALALFVASKNWRPRTLRIAGTVAAMLIALIVLDIGRQAIRDQASEKAIAELELAAVAVQGMSGAVPADQVRRSIAIACTVAKSDSRSCDLRDLPNPDPPLTVQDLADPLPVALAFMRLRLAEYRAAALARAEDLTAVEDARKAVASAQGDIAVPAADPPSLAETAAAGANAIASDAFRNESPVALEAAGWLVIALAALLFWRLIELRSFRQLAGPVTIKPKPAESPHEHDAAATPAIQEATFRASVLRNLAEPGAIPGSSALESITDLLELPGVGQSWFAPIFNAVKNIIRTPRGSDISFDVVPPDVGGSPWSVLVRVSDAGTGDEIDVSTQIAADGIQACRSAGFWAAAVVLSRSSRVASWASWDKDTSEAMARFEDPSRQTTSDLECAVARAPSSGVLLQKLSFSYALDRRPLDAISACARAVAAHPRYSIARYRLAVELNMLAADIEPWNGASVADRRRIAGQIKRAAEAMGVTGVDCVNFDVLAANPPSSCCPPTDAKPLGPPAIIFERLSFAMHQRIKHTLTWPVVISRGLRRSERAIWWPPGVRKFGRNSPRNLAKWTTRSVRLVGPNGADSRQAQKDLDKVKKRARKHWSWYQLSYNLACRYSREREADEAMTWLETSLERPGNWQLNEGWTVVDPDLENVRQTVRFKWVQRQLQLQRDKDK